jgi:hypothetical protein
MDKNLEQNANLNDSNGTRETSEILRTREQAIQSAPGPNAPPSVIRQRIPDAEENESHVLDPFDPKNHKKPQDPRLNPGADPAACVLPNAIEHVNRRSPGSSVSIPTPPIGLSCHCT